MQKKVNKLLFWFILIQPFLEIYWLYRGKLANILPFTIPTIIRMAGIIIVFMLFIGQKTNWRRLSKQKWLIAYLIALALYAIAHLYHVQHFKTIDPTGYGYSAFGEIFYLVRMFLPLLIIYMTRYTTFTKKQFEIVVQTLSGLFSVTIVLSNLFVVSLTAYGSYGVRWIHANIFAWFTNNQYVYYELASKGYFNLANTTSAILFMLLPLMLYLLVTRFNWLNITLTICQCLAMLMLGTRVAAFGLIISLVVFLIVYLLHVLILKNIKFSMKFFITFVLIAAGSAAILPHSPTFRRNTYDTGVAQVRTKRNKVFNLDSKLKKGLKENKTREEKEEFLKKFIKKHYAAYSLKKQFVLRSYSYKYDPYFWLDVMHWPANERFNYRRIEIKMLKQVMANNNSPLDKWLGLSFMRENYLFPLERDFLAQYYSLGLIGMLLYLGPYVLSLLYLIYSWLRRKENRTFLMTSLIVAIGFILTAAFYSGNVMDYLTATMILSFFIGYGLQITYRKKKDEDVSELNTESK